MPTSFSRSMRSLEADRSRGTTLGIAIGLLLLAAWGTWFLLARVALYEVSDQARLEVDREPYAVMTLVAGRVVRNEMVLGREVDKGEVLVELDAEKIRFQLEEERAEAAGLREQLDRLKREFQAQDLALVQAKRAEGSALAEARARHQEALETLRFAEQESSRIANLHRQGLVSRSEADAAHAEAQKRLKAAEALAKSLERLENDRRFEQSEKRAELSALERRAAEIEAMLARLVAVERRLEHELSLHVLRAPVSGRIGEVVRLKVGEVVRATQRLGTVIPKGAIRVVAQFAPHRALGRIQPGQAARLRLRGFSWVQYGAVPATVSRVGSEPQDGFVRVELALEEPEEFPVPLHHGLPGTLEVEVERLSPAALVLRAAGGVVSRPVAAVVP